METYKFILTATGVLAIDAIYLKLIGPHYSSVIKRVQKSPLEINYWGALGSYIAVIIALYYFIIRLRKSPREAFILGFLIYGVYEMTTIALLKDWEWTTVVIDTFWGGCLFAIVTLLVRKIISF